ncbi:MAG TPA: TfoX/Sxy family protein [Anaeromyxobacter sp.]
MPTDPSFIAHVLDLLAPVGEVTARAMFGGHGIYAEAVMFGLLDDDELFLKTDDATRATFVEAGCRQWHYVNKKVRMENTGYFRPPDEAHEDPEAMAPWARLALESALRARAKKGARGKRTAAAKRSPSPPQGSPLISATPKNLAPLGNHGTCVA